MRLRQILLTSTLVISLFSCKKENDNPDSKVPVDSKRKILLKDIVLPRLPSPYYHFEYGSDSLVAKVNFASGFLIYDVLYSSGRIGEMRNNIIVNHDTLRYFYSNDGNLVEVKFIDENNVEKRHVHFQYADKKVTRIDWDHKSNEGGFDIDRTLTFTYHFDGNLKEMVEHRAATAVSPALNYTTHYDDYDNKINVDDFTLIHDGIHDHFLVLPDLRLQSNNARKVWLTGGANQYIVKYDFTYNNDGTPTSRSGKLVFTSGNQTGEQFSVSTTYTYY